MFKQGDKVRCVLPDPAGRLTEGNVYKVRGAYVDSTGQSFVYVSGISSEFFVHRFVPAHQVMYKNKDKRLACSK